MTQPVLAYVGLGANLGNLQETLLSACDTLRTLPHISDLTLSPLYKTIPIDADGPDFVNGVARFYTSLSPHELLLLLFELEDNHGRQRHYHNAPRTLDLDLLLYGDQQINTDTLTVPHPRMHQRAFVLQPLADLAPQLQLAQGNIQSLLAACSSQGITPLN